MFPGAAITKYPALHGVNNENVLSHSFGGQESEIKATTAGLVPSESCEGESVHASLPASGGRPAIVAIPWLIETSPRSLPASSRSVLPVCVYVRTSPFYKNTSHVGLGPTPMTSS